MEELINKLRQYEEPYISEDNKMSFKTESFIKDDGEAGVVINKYEDEELYEVFFYLTKDTNTVSRLARKTFNHILDANNYFDELDDMLRNKTNDYVLTYCKK